MELSFTTEEILHDMAVVNKLTQDVRLLWVKICKY